MRRSARARMYLSRWCPPSRPVQTAGTVGRSTVLSAELEIENGYQVWAVELRDAKGNPGTVMIDAGTGQLLAFDTG